MLRDLDSEAWERIQHAMDACRRVFGMRGYRRIETPLLERTELFLRKSGGELASRLYSFTDPGGHSVSLRPEFTAPVIRHVLEDDGLAILPRRFEYGGPVFRYPSPGTPAEGEPGVFMQAGAELVGAPAPRGDGEIIAMACEGLRTLGIGEIRVTIGHMGLLWDLLMSLRLSDRARFFLVNSVGDLARSRRDKVRSRAADLGLISTEDAGRARAGAPGGGRAFADLAESVLGRDLEGSAQILTGGRSPQEIAARLAEKMSAAEEPGAVDAAIDLLASLSAVRGPASKAIAEGRAVARRAGRDEAPFDALEKVVAAAVAEGVGEGHLKIDFGLARGIAYYTGAVFDLSAGDSNASIGGGGRYDGLMRALGARRDVPALGFAYNLDAVLGVAGSAPAAANRRLVVIAPKSPESLHAAAARAAALRRDAVAAVVDLVRESRAEVRAFARQESATEIEHVDADGSIESERP